MIRTWHTWRRCSNSEKTLRGNGNYRIYLRLREQGLTVTISMRRANALHSGHLSTIWVAWGKTWQTRRFDSASAHTVNISCSVAGRTSFSINKMGIKGMSVGANPTFVVVV